LHATRGFLEGPEIKDEPDDIDEGRLDKVNTPLDRPIHAVDDIEQ
jgi:hypothetical protein